MISRPQAAGVVVGHTADLPAAFRDLSPETGVSDQPLRPLNGLTPSGGPSPPWPRPSREDVPWSGRGRPMLRPVLVDGSYRHRPRQLLPKCGRSWEVAVKTFRRSGGQESAGSVCVPTAERPTHRVLPEHAHDWTDMVKAVRTFPYRGRLHQHGPGHDLRPRRGFFCPTEGAPACPARHYPSSPTGKCLRRLPGPAHQAEELPTVEISRRATPLRSELVGQSPTPRDTHVYTVTTSTPGPENLRGTHTVHLPEIEGRKLRNIQKKKPPRNLVTDRVTSTGFSVSWTPAPGRVHQYRVVWKSKISGETGEKTVPGDQAQTPLEGLSPETLYQVSVAAVYPHGETIDQTITVTEETKDSMRVSWPPAPGRVTHYRVKYVSQDPDETLNVPILTPVKAPHTSIVLKRLRPLTTYHVQVHPLYRHGEGKARQGLGTTRTLRYIPYTTASYTTASYTTASYITLHLHHGQLHHATQLHHAHLHHSQLHHASYTTPTYTTPTYTTASYTTASYTTASYTTPTYTTPTYTTPTYTTASYTTASYTTASYTTPTYTTPTYTTASYTTPSYTTPTYTMPTYTMTIDQTITVTEETKDSMRVSWPPAPGRVTHYRVKYVSQDPDETLNVPILTPVKAPHTSIVLKRLRPLTTYHVQVHPLYRHGEGKARQGLGTTRTLVHRSALTHTIRDTYRIPRPATPRPATPLPATSRSTYTTASYTTPTYTTPSYTTPTYTTASYTTASYTTATYTTPTYTTPTYTTASYTTASYTTASYTTPTYTTPTYTTASYTTPSYTTPTYTMPTYTMMSPYKAPRNLKTSEPTKTSFRVSWDPAPGDVKGYKVTFHPIDNDVDLGEMLVGPHDRTIVLEELRAGTKYSVAVSGVFDDGVSLPLAGEEKTTLVDVTESPRPPGPS
ncbi:LOW QUALITY PROTEIN: hypothetical protein CRUP_009533, partial [Coryphaenoides rupestris]